MPISSGGPGRRRRVRPFAAVVVVVVVGLGFVSSGTGSALAEGADRFPGEEVLADGVLLADRTFAGPVRTVEVRVNPGAPVRWSTVVSSDRVDGGLETVSSMCHRAGALACVNANFTTCPSCGQPFGGVVRDGVIVRSPSPFQDEVSVVGGRLTSEQWPWNAGLYALGSDLGLTGSVTVGGINTPIPTDGIVLYTPDYGPRTPTPPGGYELVLRAPEPLRTGPEVRQRTTPVRADASGRVAVPADGVVVSGVGEGAHELKSFVDRHHGTAPIDLLTQTPAGLEQSFAGHPILLRDGAPVPLDGRDGKVSGRHPRTIVGWNDQGSVWLVAVDGRQRHSRGMTLGEATRHLFSLGATDAVNLDGGGSSTLVAPCPTTPGRCVRNAPSDGRQRRVTVALVLHSTAPPPPPPPPPPTTAPPPTTTPAPSPVPPAAAAAAVTPPPSAAPAPEPAAPAAPDTEVEAPVDAPPEPEETGTAPEQPVAPPPAPTTVPPPVDPSDVALPVHPSLSAAVPQVPGPVGPAGGTTRGTTAVLAAVFILAQTGVLRRSWRAIIRVR